MSVLGKASSSDPSEESQESQQAQIQCSILWHEIKKGKENPATKSESEKLMLQWKMNVKKPEKGSVVIFFIKAAKFYIQFLILHLIFNFTFNFYIQFLHSIFHHQFLIWGLIFPQINIAMKPQVYTG